MSSVEILRAATLLGASLTMSALLTAAEYSGRLDPIPDRGTRSYVKLQLAPAELLALLPQPLPAGAQAWAPAQPLTVKARSFAVIAVASSDGSCALWLDRDGSGRFDASEVWPIPAGQSSIALTLPWDNGFIRAFPIELALSRTDPFGPLGTTVPVSSTVLAGMTFNFNVVFAATVDFGGRALRLTFAPRPAEEQINLSTARISLDTNFNGRMEPDLGETENPSGKSPVFRLGNGYFAVKSVDMKTGVVVIEERPAAEYTRFDALPGQEMPDFAFTTLEGKRHRLSDFRGKLVLLDFWGTWCGPCIAEMKHLDPLYARFHPRGFEVIGMNMEKTSGGLTAQEYQAVNEKVRSFIGKAGHAWIQATQESIERVAIEVIHVNSYPTVILLDREGRVISRNARGEELAAMLERLLP
jgi:thiol-disulfide isomerase/thioredoxin